MNHSVCISGSLFGETLLIFLVCKELDGATSEFECAQSLQIIIIIVTNRQVCQTAAEGKGPPKACLNRSNSTPHAVALVRTQSSGFMRPLHLCDRQRMTDCVLPSSGRSKRHQEGEKGHQFLLQTVRFFIDAFRNNNHGGRIFFPTDTAVSLVPNRTWRATLNSYIEHDYQTGLSSCLQGKQDKYNIGNHYVWTTNVQ